MSSASGQSCGDTWNGVLQAVLQACRHSRPPSFPSTYHSYPKNVLPADPVFGKLLLLGCVSGLGGVGMLISICQMGLDGGHMGLTLHLTS